MAKINAKYKVYNGIEWVELTFTPSDHTHYATHIPIDGSAGSPTISTEIADIKFELTGKANSSHSHSEYLSLTDGGTVRGDTTFTEKVFIESETFHNVANRKFVVGNNSRAVLITGDSIACYSGEDSMEMMPLYINGGNGNDENHKYGDVIIGCWNGTNTVKLQGVVEENGVALSTRYYPNFRLNIDPDYVNYDSIQVKFLTVDYSDYNTRNNAYFKLSAASCSYNGFSDHFLEDIIIGVRVSAMGEVSVVCDVHKYCQTEATLDGATRNYGDVFYVIDKTYDKVDFYILCGKYNSSQFTPFTKIGSTTSSGITQYTGTATYYSSGDKVWANGNSSIYATASTLANYLPLTGGTISGAITHSSDMLLNSNNNVFRFGGTDGNGTLAVLANTGTSCYLRPGVHNKLDLGTSDEKWKDIYFTGNLTDGTNSVAVSNIVKKDGYTMRASSTVGKFYYNTGAGEKSVQVKMPTIPSKTSQLTNDSGYLTSSIKYNASNPSTYIGYSTEENENSDYQVAFKGNNDVLGICWSKFANRTNEAKNPSECLVNGFYYVSSVVDSLDGADANPFRQYHPENPDFRILTTAYSDIWLQQIATDFRSPHIYTRRRENEVWTKWVKLSSESDLANYVPSSLLDNASGVDDIGWTHDDTTNPRIATANRIAHWNGAYDNAGASNLKYCEGGIIASQNWVNANYPSSSGGSTLYMHHIRVFSSEGTINYTSLCVISSQSTAYTKTTIYTSFGNKWLVASGWTNTTLAAHAIYFESSTKYKIMVGMTGASSSSSITTFTDQVVKVS